MRRAALASWQHRSRYVTEYKGGGCGNQPRSAASSRSVGSSVARRPPLRRQTRRLDVVRRSLPGNMPALLMRRVGGLMRLYLLEHGRQPFVVDDRIGLHGLDLVEHLETEGRSVELNREPAVRVVHHLHLLAHQITGERRRI